MIMLKKTFQRVIVLALLATLYTSAAVAQEVPVYIGNTEVYLFVEELAAAGLVDVNSAVNDSFEYKITRNRK